VIAERGRPARHAPVLARTVSTTPRTVVCWWSSRNRGSCRRARRSCHPPRPGCRARGRFRVRSGLCGVAARTSGKFLGTRGNLFGSSGNTRADLKMIKRWECCYEQDRVRRAQTPDGDRHAFEFVDICCLCVPGQPRRCSRRVWRLHAVVSFRTFMTRRTSRPSRCISCGVVEQTSGTSHRPSLILPAHMWHERC
jgi:hypothetical protein